MGGSQARSLYVTPPPAAPHPITPHLWVLTDSGPDSVTGRTIVALTWAVSLSIKFFWALNSEDVGLTSICNCCAGLWRLWFCRFSLCSLCRAQRHIMGILELRVVRGCGYLGRIPNFSEPPPPIHTHTHVANLLGVKYFCPLTIPEKLFGCWL